jgi:hypothetical protein
MAGCWSYDSFGNRTAKSYQPAACPAPTIPPTLAPTATYNGNNQVTRTSVNAAGTSFQFDTAGNVLNDGQNQYLYDGDGQICAVASTPMPGMTVMTGYLYDASGTRVAKGSISKWSCDPTVSGFQTTNDYILGLGGEQVTEMGMGGAASSNSTDGTTTSGLTWQHTNIYAAGSLIATYDDLRPALLLQRSSRHAPRPNRLRRRAGANLLQSALRRPPELYCLNHYPHRTPLHRQRT